MAKPKVSIIANFYNSGKYIPKLIDSVLKQSFTEWELIVVNDCSPGNDLEILKNYSGKEILQGRYTIVDNTSNLGIAKAKAEGIKHAKGEYITFIDGDDWLEPFALQKMFLPSQRYDCDVVIANSYYRNFPGFRLLIENKNVRFNEIYDKEKINKDLIKAFFGHNILCSYAYWGKLFKTSLVKKLNYQNNGVTLCEDIFFNLKIFLESEKIIFIEDPVYHWRWGGISSGALKKSEASFQKIEILNNFNDFYYRRLKIAEKLNNPQLITLLRYEMLNVLKENMPSVCSRKPGNTMSQNAKLFLESIISKPGYQEIVCLRPIINVKHNEIIDAIESKNIDWLYNYFYKSYKKQWKNRLIRKLAAKFL